MNQHFLAASTTLPTIGGEGLGGYTKASSTTVASIISKTLGFLTIIAGLWFIVQFVLAAVTWISAGGDKGKTTQAKEKITNAIIGLAVVVAAYAITALISSILGLNFLNIESALNALKPALKPEENTTYSPINDSLAN